MRDEPIPLSWNEGFTATGASAIACTIPDCVSIGKRLNRMWPTTLPAISATMETTTRPSARRRSTRAPSSSVFEGHAVDLANSFAIRRLLLPDNELNRCRLHLALGLFHFF